MCKAVYSVDKELQVRKGIDKDVYVAFILA